MKNFAKLLMMILPFALIMSCVSLPTGPPPDPNNPVKRVAILPLKNDTTDVDGPNFVRSKLAEEMQKHHYNVKPIAEVDQLLRDRMGITLGGQLDLASIEKLKETLDVEGLVYGTLMDFGEKTTGIYNVRKVRGKFRLVNTLNGQTFWENGIGVKSETRMAGKAGTGTAIAAAISDSKDKDVPWITLQSQETNDDFKTALAKSLGQKLLAKATNTHLLRETTEMVRRVTETLPTGPGAIAVASIPSIPMPEIKMPPPPSFGYMDYGKKDFRTIIVSTSLDTTSNETVTSKIPFAKAGNKIRLDIDMAQMTKGAQIPPALSKTTTIYRGDKKITYSLYPNAKKYFVYDETDDNYYEQPVVKKTRVGTETIDGHPTIKYKVTITYKNGTVQQGFFWDATDLDGMTIKTELTEKNYRFSSILTNIKLGTPPSVLFEIPAGFDKAGSMLDLLANE